MIPQVVPRKQLRRRERHLHADAQRGVRDRVRAARPARRDARRRPGPDPHRRRSATSSRRASAGRCRRRRRSGRRAPSADSMTHDAEAAMGSTFAQLREGIAFIRGNPTIGWSLTYLAIAASLVGVLGVLGPNFARDALGLEPKDFVVVVLPLGFGIVMGILLLNTYGQHFRRGAGSSRAAWSSLGILLALLVGRRADLPLPPARRGGDRPRVARRLHLAARDRRAHRVPRRASPTRSSPSPARRSSRRTSPRRSAAGCSASSTCSCRWRASCRSSSSARSRTSSATRPCCSWWARPSSHRASSRSSPAGRSSRSRRTRPPTARAACRVRSGGRRDRGRDRGGRPAEQQPVRSAAAAAMLAGAAPGNADGTGEPLATGEEPGVAATPAGCHAARPPTRSRTPSTDAS